MAVYGLNNQALAQMSGNYTIDKNSAASSTNFQSYTSAVQALRGLTRSDGGPSLGGGVNGAVTISVVQGSGPYTEQLDVQAITGTSSTNRVTFVGNGEQITYSPSSTNSAVIKVNGADYLTFRDIYVKPTHSTYTRAFWVLNASDYLIIEDCEMDITSASSTSNGYGCGIAHVGSSTSATSYSTGGNKGYGNIYRNNEIYGSTSNNGMYSGIIINGSSSMSNLNLLIEGNYIHNYYYNGIYAYYNCLNTVYKGNTIIRGDKSSFGTHYGIYHYYCSGGKFYDNYVADNANSNGYSYTNYGIYAYYGTSSNASVLEFVNNTINLNSGGYRMGIYGNEYYATGKKYLHNTIYMRSSQGYGYGIYSYTYNYGTVEYKNNIIDASFNNYQSTFYNIYNYSYGTVDADGNVLPRNNTSQHYTGYLYTLTNGGGTAQTFANW
ncbi:MAG TPA: hypothetical protein DIW47_04830, partial [Bacteroidetes bacterium]|nr:hypothetical protein [Bacteroidota bacterium]